MTKYNTCYVIANFGGPRSPEEIEPFLKELLTDKDVVRTSMPQWLHNIVFKYIAKKRRSKVFKEYESMGGFSPTFSDTEAIAKQLHKKLHAPVFTFHRYLSKTHSKFIQDIHSNNSEQIIVFPMFPQFTYATTGSIARWLNTHLKKTSTNKLRWIKSYPNHPAFSQSYVHCIKDFIREKKLHEEKLFLIFSAHGIPQKFIDTGDLYQSECELSFQSIMKAFPKTRGILSYQSKFGPEEWLRPYTYNISKEIKRFHGGRKDILFIPISFTSDHIETLVEIEKDYINTIKKQGLNAFRVPALNLRSDWIDSIVNIIKDSNYCNNQMLIRHE